MIINFSETGAGGSAPKHVEQLLKENHLRWDSLGEYLATAIGFQELGTRTSSSNATLLGDSLMNAVGKYLDTDKSPGRKVNQLDNRGSHFYIALYWAEELAKKDNSWSSLALALLDNEGKIVKVSCIVYYEIVNSAIKFCYFFRTSLTAKIFLLILVDITRLILQRPKLL